jgi:signal recognition particle subunit SRP54
VNTARAFDAQVGITGIVLTRMDGDGRGGAALSMRAVTGKPIKLMGVGEKVDALEEFHPARVANRILGMGDIVSLVEKASENIDQAEAMRMAEKMRKGTFDLSDMRAQLAQIEKIGGLGGMMNMMPGMAKMKDQLAGANMDEKLIKRQVAIINSMTPQERANPDLLKASRKRRIAAGSGTNAEQVNKLLKMHRQMADMMKMMGKGGKRGAMAGIANMFGLGGGMPQMSPEMIAQMQAEAAKGGGALGGNALSGGLPDQMPQLPSGTTLPPALERALGGAGLNTGSNALQRMLPKLGGGFPFKKK